MKVEIKYIFYFKNIFHWTSLFATYLYIWNIFWPHVVVFFYKVMLTFYAQSNINPCNFYSLNMLFLSELHSQNKGTKAVTGTVAFQKVLMFTIQVLRSINIK